MPVVVSLDVEVASRGHRCVVRDADVPLVRTAAPLTYRHLGVYMIIHIAIRKPDREGGGWDNLVSKLPHLA
jgi:hypothetical protein